MVEIEKKNMEPERRTKVLRVMNLLRRERERVQGKKEQVVSRKSKRTRIVNRGDATQMSVGFVLPVTQHNVFRSVLGERWESSSSGSRSVPL